MCVFIPMGGPHDKYSGKFVEVGTFYLVSQENMLFSRKKKSQSKGALKEHKDCPLIPEIKIKVRFRCRCTFTETQYYTSQWNVLTNEVIPMCVCFLIGCVAWSMYWLQWVSSLATPSWRPVLSSTRFRSTTAAPRDSSTSRASASPSTGSSTSSMTWYSP